ncbi:MAG: pantoate--beta-alanine ligase, partial [bacterium]
MFIFHSSDLLHAALLKCKVEGQTIGFVPTMGALHFGHYSLLERAKSENDTVVCSVFVNPKQFDDKTDLDNYPNPIQADITMLQSAGVDILFYPGVDQVYGTTFDDSDVQLEGLDLIHEGAQRPGHFQGVAKVVKRFLDIVKPTRAYFGQKDFQQTVVVHYLIKSLQIDSQMVVCPIVREPHGLAMSSRNERLSPAKRDKAAFIYKSLLKFKERCFFKPLQEAKDTTLTYLQSIDDAVVEYFVVVDGVTLQEVEDLKSSSYIAALTVVR